MITHRETKFSELPGTEGSATVSTQSTALGLPVQLKGCLAQGLQLFPLLLRVGRRNKLTLCDKGKHP